MKMFFLSMLMISILYFHMNFDNFYLRFFCAYQLSNTIKIRAKQKKRNITCL
jgi:hypothetical protein